MKEPKCIGKTTQSQYTKTILKNTKATKRT